MQSAESTKSNVVHTDTDASSAVENEEVLKALAIDTEGTPAPEAKQPELPVKVSVIVPILPVSRKHRLYHYPVPRVEYFHPLGCTPFRDSR